jgi:protein-S-isoprenylcysteine O-methyltransferase Ste14
MSFEEQFITITFLFILLFILCITRIVINKISAKESFIFRKKFKRLNWFAILKYWVYFQVGCLVLSITRLHENILTIICLPLILSFVIIFFALINRDESDIIKENNEEFIDYKKRFDRAKRINKIL